MTTNTILLGYETLVLNAAAKRQKGIALPMPANLDGNAAGAKTIERLLNKKLIAAVDASDFDADVLHKALPLPPTWKIGKAGYVTLQITDAGRELVGVKLSTADREQAIADATGQEQLSGAKPAKGFTWKGDEAPAEDGELVPGAAEKISEVAAKVAAKIVAGKKRRAASGLAEAASAGVTRLMAAENMLSANLAGAPPASRFPQVQARKANAAKRRTAAVPAKAAVAKTSAPAKAVKAKAKRANAPATKGGDREPSKQDQVVAMLKRKSGASIDELASHFGWEKHTVRGMIAGALKKKLGLPVTAEKDEKRGTVYRLA